MQRNKVPYFDYFSCSLTTKLRIVIAENQRYKIVAQRQAYLNLVSHD